MLRSMFSGISGLRSHQTMMDVVGNNIANVNTTGYKATRATFQESLTQVMRGATAPLAPAGGINPLQVGLGAQVGAIDGMFGQGALQTTGRATDLAVVGEGWFVVDTEDGAAYTRSGAFSFDAAGKLVGANGETVRVTPTADATAADGTFALPAGEYGGIAINARGEISGRDAAGVEVLLGTIQMATVTNPGGMVRLGNGLFGETPNAGVQPPGNPADVGAGTVQSGVLEMSNVDLAQEFTNLILAQRGFQANSRTITAADEILQDLVNLKR